MARFCLTFILCLAVLRIGMIGGHDLRHDLFDPGRFVPALPIEQLQFFLKVFIIHSDRLADIDEFVLGFLYAFFVHQKFFVELLARP